MNKVFFAGLLVAGTAVLTSAAQAHFQLLFTPETMLEKGGVVTLKMPFTHPADSGHVMEMGAPLEFYSIHKGKKTDLLGQLKEINWTSSENTGKAFEAELKLRGLGDSVFVLVPTPYYEASEDVYIQQLTKSYINVGDLPTDWDSEQGLKTEIRPLGKPYNVIAGGTFSGVVLSEGKPVPFAEIEIEYMNFPAEPEKNRFSETALISSPAHALRADASGTFTFGVPKAGFWGIAALGTGPDSEYEGKTLSQDAVIWIQARDID
ncbi:DUF4198 domain-containing protein [Kiloniella laminariae]|uniref:DUF4198 domain-containing protein n=1 Tax=Kiloniella laminariae TaxID=454162 RepID=A0ABT4LPG8_9PROT|nr:DUF4198 domain-containing protein [Kiloniella laminariae]MCZ4283027.1 DUF4198 domain-containing protein [Kiloniella laminariae]